MPRLKLSLLSLLLVALSLSLWLPLAAQDLPANVRQIPVTSIGFHGKLSPDGATLVIYEDMNLLGEDTVDESLLPVRVIDLASGKETAQLTGFTDYAADAAFTSDGKRLATYHSNGDFYLWDMADLSAPVNVWQTALLGQGRIQFMPDDTTLVTLVGGQTQRLLLVDMSTGYITGMIGPRFASLTEFRQTYTQFPEMGDVSFAGFALSPAGDLLAASTINDEVALWDMADNSKGVLRQKSEKFAQFNVRQLYFTPDGQTLLYFDRDDNLTHIWDVGTRKETGTMAGGQIMALSADGSQLAWIGERDEGGQAIFTAALNAPDDVTAVVDLGVDTNFIPPIAFLYFTADGKQLVLGGWVAQDLNNAIYVIDVG